MKQARPTSSMIDAAREGLQLYDLGYAGRGLVRETVATAERIAKGAPLPAEWWQRAAAWHARHGAAPAERAARADRTSPARVAWLLWGGADGERQAPAIVAALRARENPRKGEASSPLRGLSAKEQYEALRWGIKARKASTVESTSPIAQPLVELGRLRALFLVDDEGEDVGALVPKRPYPHLAVGAKDNRLYIVGGSTDDMAAAGDWGQPGRHNLFVRRTDYTARKGTDTRDVVYWYHDHERPFPRYTVREDGRPHLQGGGYKVASEGIVG